MYSVECQNARQLDFKISYSQVHTYSVGCHMHVNLTLVYLIVRYIRTV